MASLKAIRTRIASVTATRKITKAMQMVAAAKLRRAQDAVTAARPYAEKMNSVIASLAKGLKGNPGAPALLAGTGRDQVHLLIVATADRGLCGGFNTNIVRLARQQIHALQREGKDGEDSHRRPQGARPAQTPVRLADRRRVRTDGVKQIGFANALTIGRKVLEMFAAGEFDVATLIYSRFKSVMSARFRPPSNSFRPRSTKPRRHQPAARSTSTSRKKPKSSPSFCRATSASRSSAPCWRTSPANSAPR